MTEKKPKKKPEHDDVIPMRDPSRGRDSRGRPMLVFPRSLLINEACLLYTSPSPRD